MVAAVTPLFPGAAWLFDSVVPPGHPWASELTRLELAAAVAERCLSANVAMDARVLPQAQSDWVIAVDATLPLLEALGAHWRRAYVQPQAKVRFSGIPARLPARRQLVHIEPFDGLFRRALSAGMHRVAALDAMVGRYTGRAGLVQGLKTPANYDALAQALNGLAEDEFREVLSEALQCIDAQGPRPFWWATLGDEVAGHGNDATALCSAMRLGNYAEGDWVLVFDYTVADSGLLYRPTTLDSGGYPFHFPSPTEHPHGLTMALRTSESPCTELLHHALPWDVAADRARPSVFKLAGAWTRTWAYAALPNQRSLQRTRLQAGHPACHPWLNRHQHRI